MPLDSPRRLRPAAVAALVVAGLVLAGCAPAKHQAEVPTGSASSSVAPTPDLAKFYDQQLEWTSCDTGECATLTVPVDYADPTGSTIGLALARQKATGSDRIGSLLVNPGGPGVSGVDFLAGAVQRIGADVRAKYDIVGFDPRGVQRSEPVRCADGPELDALFASDPDYSTDAGIQHVIDVYGEFGKECSNRTGALLGHVDTESAARDMDVMRAVLGDDQLHYLGYSYGTQLGAVYAAVFPENVGRLVLDGALDPTLTPGEVSKGQAIGIESALRAYVTDCQGGKGCPLTGDVDHGLGQIWALFDEAKANPLPTGTDRDLTQSLAFYGVAVTLYSQSLWPTLTAALKPALQGDGSKLLQLSDAYFDRQADGTYASNANEAFFAIHCADARESADFDDMRAQAADIEAAAPTVGSFLTFGGTTCAQWPTPAVDPLPSYAAEGAAPILVIGTTNDPATPYAWAQMLAETLSSGELLTYEGEGHTAYGASNDCIGGAVDTYLLTGTMPPEGTRC
ncbi:alpha/beta hydrolase [Cellulomonas chitinilytica]|uniref:alpha/beta hydrolase n=1 Tax=Cellulomonas chitinilytica TaxID=398759 RepID=UPI001EF24283|nr:alpha/beta hydrolase [Cellulomonas chitinilytica]